MKKLILISLTLLAFMLSNSLYAQKAEAFYSTEKVQDIKVSFEQDNWRYLLDSLRVNGNGLLLGNVEINGQVYKNVGVRYRGTKSFQPGGKRNALHIKLNYINKKQNIDGNKAIKLSNSLRDPSLVREVLAYEIARDYMPAPQANYAKVTVNKVFYGLFVNVETIGSEFLEERFGTTSGAFFKVNSSADKSTPEGCKKNIFGSLEYDAQAKCYLNNFEMISEEGWDDLMSLAKTLSENPNKISDVLDVDKTLWMLALNNILVNLDSYSGKNSQNFYLYQDKNGRFVPIIWDMNLAFGSYKNTGVGSDLSLKELQMLDPMLHADNNLKPLISQLLQNEQHKRIYLGHMRTILYDWFVSEKYVKRSEELRRLIQVPYINDQNKQYSFTDFQNALKKTIGKRSRIPGIVELMKARTSFLKKHQSLAVIPAEISDVKVLGRTQFSNRPIDNFKVVAKVERYPKRVWAIYRLSKFGSFKSAQMFDDGKHNDGAANDGVFGAIIEPEMGESIIEYYIQAENATMMSYSPSRYMYERYSATLSELNE